MIVIDKVLYGRDLAGSIKLDGEDGRVFLRKCYWSWVLKLSKGLLSKVRGDCCGRYGGKDFGIFRNW